MQLVVGNLEEVIVNGSVTLGQRVGEGLDVFGVDRCQLADIPTCDKVILEDGVTKGDVRRCLVEVQNHVWLQLRRLTVARVVNGYGEKFILLASLHWEGKHRVNRDGVNFFVDAIVVGEVEQ